MKILSLDTSTDIGSVAILEDTQVLALRLIRSPMRHLAWLAPTIAQILEESGAAFKQISAIATSLGPGSFTGIRLGLTTARTLAQVGHIPLYGVSSLDALAFQALPYSGTIVSCIDARREELFTGIYQASGESFKQTQDYLCLTKENLLKLLSTQSGPFIFVGETNPHQPFFLKNLPNSHAAPPHFGMVLASSIGVLAYQRRHELSGNPHQALPLYIRASSAELALKQQQTGQS